MKYLYWSLPRWFRRILIRLYFCFASFYRLYEVLRPKVVLLSGMERTNGKDLCIAVAGPQETQAWFSAIAFLDRPENLSKGRVWKWNVWPIIKKAVPSCSFGVIQSRPIFENRTHLADAFKIPSWIELDLDITPEGIRNKQNRYSDVARTITKNKLSFIVTKRDDDFRHFYYQMYEPYIQSRYGRSAVIIPFIRLKEELIDGELITILMGSQPIAGCLLKKNKSQVAVSKLGVLHGDFSYVKSGCISAMVYFVAHYLQNKGHKTMHMGFSRPFLSDGPLHFKKLFGARITNTRLNKTREILYLKPLKHDQATRDFLVANPFVCFSSAGSPQVAVFLEMPDSGLQISYSDFSDAKSGSSTAMK